MVTQKRLKEVLDYDQDTGIFTWKHSRGSVKKGKSVVTLNRGYLQAQIDGRIYLCHRLAWLYVNDCIPDEIDHINGVRNDNSINNLRSATRSQNNMNSKIPSNNTSGYKGVYYVKRSKKNPWMSQLRIDGDTYYLGVYTTKEKAFDAYCIKAKELFGEFFRSK